MDIYSQRFLERFKTVKSGCWEWTWGLTSAGYGRFWGGKRKVGAHIFSYEYHNNLKPLQKGQIVCYTCDNPKCVNPDHLFLGTHQDNANDRNKKKRQAFGERNAEATITEKIAKAIIKELNGKKEGYKRITKKFNTSIWIVSKISRNKTWKHLSRGLSG